MYTDEESLHNLKQISAFPEFNKAKIISIGDTITCESFWSVRNLVTLKKTPSSCLHHWNESRGDITPFTISPMLENVELIAYDLERKQKAYLIQTNDTPAKRFITVYPQGNVPCTIDLTDSKLHGEVYSDVELGSLSFSPDGKSLVFVAEKFCPKPKSIFESPEKDEKSNFGEKFLYKEDWGEQLTGKEKNVIVVVPVNEALQTDENSRVLLSPPDCYASVGQIQWAGPRALVGVAYYDSSPRLGLIYCRVRESVLFYVSLDDGAFIELTPRGYWVGSPRLSPSLTQLVYLSGPMGGPHVNGCKLVSRPWGANPIVKPVPEKIIIDYYDCEKVSEDDIFSGLYSSNFLPARCFINDNCLLLTTLGRTQMKSYALTLDSGSLTRVNGEYSGSTRVLDVVGNYILTVSSAFNSYPRVDIYKQVNREIKLVKTIADFGSEELPFSVDNYIMDDNEDKVTVPVMHVGPSSASPSKKPLILYLHGGPHSSIVSSYSMSVHLFSLLGFHVIFPNYRGSLGVGCKGIKSLLGRVGEIDVDDCHKAALEAIKKYEDIDASNVYLYGGSHGGFLVTSLSADYSDFYRAVSTRNPVTDIATMAGITDIPDWTHLEACGSDNHTSAPSAATLKRMMEVSPVSKVDKVKAPTLLLLGSKDRRVPMSQGIKYHQFLKRREVPTRVHIYEDVHSLAKVEVEMECLQLTLMWFRKFRK